MYRRLFKSLVRHFPLIQLPFNAPLLAIVGIVSCCYIVATDALAKTQGQANFPPTQVANLLNSTTHNRGWFTQGLYLEGDTIYTSSGQYGRSLIIKQQSQPSRQQKRRLSSRYFAEGLTVVGDTLYLLTWKEQSLLLFDKENLKPKGKLSYKGEGWGLSHRVLGDGNSVELIMSNGSEILSFRDPESFSIKRELHIPGLNHLNELEYVDGIIWANRWYDNHLYGIDSQSGCIVARVDLSPLRKQAGAVNPDHVTNGVAFDAQQQGLWVTGKHWSKRFLITMPNLTDSHC